MNTNAKVSTNTAALKSQPINTSALNLAKQVLAGGTNVESVLRNAILASGISIREKNKTITQAVKPGQGLIFNHWEVEAMVKMSHMGMTLNLT